MSNLNIKNIYPYLDENGKLLYQVLRLEPKSFIQRQVINNEWAYNLKGVRRVLYNLPEVIKNWIVFIVEGEKDVETLRMKELTATTCSGGSSSWKKEYNHFFKDKIVYIIPDNDKAGHDFSKKIAINIFPFVYKIKIIHLPSLKNGEDITDWFSYGHSKQDLIKAYLGALLLTKQDIKTFTQLFSKTIRKKPIYDISIPKNDIEKALQCPMELLVDIVKGKAFCVNHAENNPSMWCKDNWAYCFSCGWHGTVIEVAQKIYKCDFKKAVILLNELQEKNRKSEAGIYV